MGDLTRPYNGPLGTASLNKESSTGSLAQKASSNHNSQTNLSPAEVFIQSLRQAGSSS